MEVEVKLRLRDAAAHQALATALSAHHRRTHLQENLFFDTATLTLSSSLAALRLRFYDLDTACTLSLKSKPSLSGGVSRIEEVEETLDPVLGRACAAEPCKLFCIGSEIMRVVREEYGVGEGELTCMGGFRNVRSVYEWEGLKLELDETRYEFGTCYEVECESEEPERVKVMIEALLRENGIAYEYSKMNKFAVFRSGKLP